MRAAIGQLLAAQLQTLLGMLKVLVQSLEHQKHWTQSGKKGRWTRQPDLQSKNLLIHHMLRSYRLRMGHTTRHRRFLSFPFTCLGSGGG